MIKIPGQQLVVWYVIPSLCAGLLFCSGCGFVQPAQDPTLPAQSTQSGHVLTSTEQQAQIIQNIQNSPNIPQSAKAAAIESVKGAPQTQSAQAGQPSNADLKKTIDQVQSSTTIPASQKAQIIAEIKRHMQ